MSTRKTARDASRPPGGATNAVKEGAHALDLSSCVNTKDRLLRVAEYLFAREGVWSARVRDINELAGQRNASALHYHFGSRRGLIKAVMLRHQLEIDVKQTPLLDELEKRTDYAVRDILEIVVVPLVARLDSPSGRDFLRIIPQILGKLSGDLRQGITIRLTMSRVIDLLDGRLGALPEPIRRERLVVYALMISSLCANYAEFIDSGVPPVLDSRAFATHLVDVISAALCAPNTVDPSVR